MGICFGRATRDYASAKKMADDFMKTQAGGDKPPECLISELGNLRIPMNTYNAMWPTKYPEFWCNNNNITESEFKQIIEILSNATKGTGSNQMSAAMKDYSHSWTRAQQRKKREDEFHAQAQAAEKVNSSQEKIVTACYEINETILKSKGLVCLKSKDMTWIGVEIQKSQNTASGTTVQ